ncbi:MAG: carbohydrate kinase family protein [Pseudomonadota bacterium]
MTSSPRLLCVGDLSLDIVIRVPRLPGHDQKVSGREVARGAGGMAANVAVGASRLGTPARLVAVLADDDFGREALAKLANEDVDLTHLTRRQDDSTFYCVILIDPSGEKALVRAAGSTFLPTSAELAAEAFEGIKHIHFIHPDPGLLQRGYEIAKTADATISLDLEATDVADTGDHLRDLLSLLNVLFLSAESREVLEARIGPLIGLDDLLIVTTKGGYGAEASHCGQSVSAEGYVVTVADTLGAGDAFAAAFLHAWLEGAEWRDALVFANAAAALSTRSHGAQAGLARPGEVADFIARKEPTLA